MMRALEEIRPERRTSAAEAAGRALRGIGTRVGAHRSGLAYLLGPLVASALLTAWNIYNYPFKATNDDEGTYAAQAWAVETWQELAHYTYWYDHPPLGWIQIAGWTWATDGFDRVDAVAAGREFMVVMKVAAIALLFVLMRRLAFRRPTAAVAAALYGMSPLAIQYGRMVFLDNITIPWVLASFVLALSPRQRLSAAVGSGLCFAIAVLSKETIVIWLPFLLWVLWRNSDRRTRTFWIGFFASAFTCAAAVYPVYALVKDEFLPGPGHVDLWSALVWQAFGRDAVGSVFTEGTTTQGWVRGWFGLDAWLLIGGLASAVGAILLSRRLRPFAVLLALHVLLVVRGGYVPYALVIPVLPLCAMLCAGLGEELVIRVSTLRRSLQRALYPAMAVGLAGVLTVMTPAWFGAIRPQLTIDANSASDQALAWLDENVPRDSWLVVNDSHWVDLVEMGYAASRVIWFYKVDSDPEVVASFDGLGWRRIDYLVQSDYDLAALGESSSQPTVGRAIAHSEVVATFESPGPEGQQHTVQVLKVRK